MPKFQVHLSTIASYTSPIIEANSPEEAIEKAIEENHASLCAQDAGYDRPWGLELGDEWEPTAVVDGETGATVVEYNPFTVNPS